MGGDIKTQISDKEDKEHFSRIYTELINHGTREMGKWLEQAYHKKDDLNVQ